MEKSDTKNYLKMILNCKRIKKMGNLKIKSSLKLIEGEKVKIESFQKLQILGTGGFSIVWKVKSKRFSQLFAMKQISKQKLKSEKYINLIITERNILKELHNPFISNLYCTFQDEYNLYFILDYFSGGDLRYYLYKEKKFSENQIKFITACLIVSLEYIHSKKIIHRDIKPENLLFDDRGYIYLCDFGISIQENSNNYISKNIGSNGYIAPEGNYSYLSDFYSLGLVIYELIFNEKYNINLKDGFKDKFREKNFSMDLYYFLEGLLEKNPNARLGHEKGVYSLKSHPFLKGFNFEGLKNKEIFSPFKPHFNPKGYVKLNVNKDKGSESTSSNSSTSSIENLKYIEGFDYICYNKINNDNNLYSSNSYKFFNVYNTPFKVNHKKIRKNNSCESSYDFSKTDLKDNIIYSSFKNIKLGKIFPKKLFKNSSMSNNVFYKKEIISCRLPVIPQKYDINNKNVNKDKYLDGYHHLNKNLFKFKPKEKIKNILKS